MYFLEAKSIVKQYSNHLALDQLNLQVPQGCVYGLLGPNGAGKTTLIRIINQITKPDSGEIIFDGHKLAPSDIARIGYLPEERGLYKKMKVGEEAIYLAQLKGLSRHDALVKLKYWFEKFGIEKWWDKKVEELSKGMQQKVQFIVTVLHEPQLLIFDEPFSGFDPINANILKNEILDLKQKGSTIIFSTHNMSSVEEICDYVTLINKSKDILSGTVDDIRERYKENIYAIKFKGEDNLAQLADEIEIRSLQSKGDIKEAIIKQTTDHTASQLISKLANAVELIGFNEQLPTMNEVFISAVGGKVINNE